MRFVIFILIISIHPAFSISQPSAESGYGLSTCEPVSYDLPTDLKSDTEVKKGNANWHNWLGGKVKKSWRSIRRKFRKVNKQVKGYTRQVVLKGVTHPLLLPAFFSDAQVEKDGLSTGFWALITYLASLVFLSFIPGFGLLVLLASFIIAMIGTVRDKDGLAIFILVMSAVTFLLVLVLALFEAFIIFAFFGA